MDMSSRSNLRTNASYQGYHTQQSTHKAQLQTAVNQVSEHSDVQGYETGKVEGTGASQRINLKQYRTFFEGVRLPVIQAPVLAHGQQTSLEAFQAATGQTVVDEASAAQQEHTGAYQTGTQASHSQAYTHGQGSHRVGATAGKEQDGASKGEGIEGNRSKEEKEAAEKVTTDAKKKSVTGEILTKEEQAEVSKLQARDREVRTHEQAHVAAGGQHIRGGIHYEYKKGPDGRDYAVGGHVNIDVSEANSPEATVTKMQQVKRAALAPAEPSSSDRAVAAEASQKEQKARQEVAIERREETRGAGQDEKGKVSIGGSRRKEAQAMQKEAQGQRKGQGQGQDPSVRGQQPQGPIRGQSTYKSVSVDQNANRLQKTVQQSRQDRRSQVQEVPQPPRARSTMSLSAQSKIKNLSFWR